nr:YqgE/AlgH family protein [Pseudomonas brassicacearum subsp. brassicacearum]
MLPHSSLPQGIGDSLRHFPACQFAPPPRHTSAYEKNVSPTYLKHHFLIAMPHMADPNFAHTLTYIVEHTANGAMGLVINRPQELNLADILEQLRPEVEPPLLCQHVPIFIGGPVQTDRGFVLHPSGPKYQATVDLDGVSLSTSQDVLFAIADGVGPEKSLIALGYAGWEPGQLEAELADNAWLTCPFDADILFNTSSELRLEAAASRLGVNLSLLTSQAGHA